MLCDESFCFFVMIDVGYCEQLVSINCEFVKVTVIQSDRLEEYLKEIVTLLRINSEIN